MFRKAVTYFLTNHTSLDELPRSIQEVAQHYLLAGTTIHGIVVIPAQDYSFQRGDWRSNLPFAWRATPQRTLIFSTEQILVLETETNDETNAIVIPLDCLVYIEFGIILLYGYLDLHWAANGQLETLKIEFNTVGERAIRDHIAWSREQIAARFGQRPFFSGPGLDVQLPFKFHNYLRYSLLPGEQVRAVAFQPVAWRGEGWFQPMISPNRAIAVTDHHLIMLSEEERRSFFNVKTKDRTPMNYGIVIHFSPLQHVQAATFKQDDDRITWLQLTLGLEDATALMDIPLDTANAWPLRDVLEKVTARL